MSAHRTLAIVSAVPEELRPLSRRLEGARRGRLGGLAVRRGTLRGREVCLAVTGEGREPAAAALERLLSEPSLEALLGVGVAGALTPDLAAGELVLAHRVAEPGGSRIQPPEWEWSERARGSSAPPGGTVVSVSEIASAPVDKRRLAAGLALEERSVVDLESWTWASAAAERGLPWLVVRSVSDTLDEELPLDFDRFRRADGSVSRSRVLARALTRPRLAVELNRLRRRVRGCALALADAAEVLVAC